MNLSLIPPPPTNQFRIGLVSDHSQLGGGETALMDLAIHLLESMQAWPYVACRLHGPLVDRLCRAGVSTRVLDYPARFRHWKVIPIFSPSAFREFGQWIAKNDIQMIHANGPFGLLYGGLAARRLGLPVVYTCHLAQDVGNAFKRMLTRFIPNRTFAVSPTLAHRLMNAGVPADRVATLPLGVNPRVFDFDLEGRRRFRAELGWEDPDLIVCGLVGRVQRVKGQLRFLEALDQARRAHPRLRGLIVGSPWPGDEKGAAYEANLKATLASERFRDVVIRRESLEFPREVYSAIDMLVVASDTESFGRVALEAMACQRPVVTTLCGGPQDIVLDGETGLIAHDLTSEGLAEEIVSLAADARWRDELGRAGRVRVTEEFDLDQLVQQCLNTYGALIANGAADRSARR